MLLALFLLFLVLLPVAAWRGVGSPSFWKSACALFGFVAFLGISPTLEKAFPPAFGATIGSAVAIFISRRREKRSAPPPESA